MDIDNVLLTLFDGNTKAFEIEKREVFDEKYFIVFFSDICWFDVFLSYYFDSVRSDMEDFCNDAWDQKPFKDWVIDIGYSDRVALMNGISQLASKD